MTATIPTARAGDLLAGKYRVDRVLGEGGMGVVLAARNELLNQDVAIKLLRPGALDDAEAVGRFMREARAAARLRSEHVARMLDVGRLDDGRPFMVMERLEGHDLGELVERKQPVHVPLAVDYILQVCEGIAEAHAAGIIHRDLKPKNLFLTQTVDGRPLVKVLDFGIAKADAMQTADDMQLTRTSEVIGSPSYMSPEQLRSSRDVDHRTDIWALGVILYELLTGRLPFYAHTVTELVLVVVSEREPPAHVLRPEIPEGLSLVVARCLGKRPDDRFANVADLAHALEPFATGLTISAAERVRGAAGSSGKALASVNSSGALPSSNTGSGPIAAAGIPTVAHGPTASAPLPLPLPLPPSTSVAWGATQVDPPRHPLPPPVAAARSPLFALVVVAGIVLGLGGGGTAVWYVKHTQHAASIHAATTETAPPPPGTVAPPIRAATVTSAIPPGDAGADPSRAAPPASEALSTSAARPPAPASSPSVARPRPAPAAAPAPKPDDLSNVGRR